MTKEQWTREVEAQWVELADTFFPMDLVVSCLDPELGKLDSPYQYIDDLEKVDGSRLSGSFFAGLDVGKHRDYSVLAVVQKAKDKLRLVYKRQFPLETPYPEVIGHVARANQVFGFSKIYVDKTGVGDVIVDEISDIGIDNVEGLFLTDRWKEEILTYLKLLMEQRKLGILPEDSTLIAQINEQQCEYMQPRTAQEHIHLKFRHPPNGHDDQLFALALACYASKEEEPPPILVRVR